MRAVKIYLEQDTIDKLKMKAKEMGFEGRGWLSHFLRSISDQDLVILNENLKKILRLVKL